MMVSTRGRYALRVMIDIAEHNSEGEYLAMREVASRQGISLKYMEKIMPLLVSGKLVEGIHGKGGGYRLTKSPSEIYVLDVLSLTDGNLAPVACLECDSSKCDRLAECRTLPMWSELHRHIHDYLDNITIADLCR